MKFLTIASHTTCLVALLSAANAKDWVSKLADPIITPAIVQPAPSALTAYSIRFFAGSVRGPGDLVRLTWKDNSTNEYTFRVERCAGATCTNFVEVAKLPANTTHFTQLFAVNPGKVYRYRVRTRGPYGFSAYTKIVNATLR